MKKYDLTLTEAAELVGIHYTTVARLVRENRLDSIEIKGLPRWKSKIRVNRKDVLALWSPESDTSKPGRKPGQRNGTGKPYVRKRPIENSPKRRKHNTREVWNVIAPCGTVVFSDTFDKCLKEKPGIELQSGQYHTMQMRGGQRIEDHSTTQGKQWEQIDRYNFYRGD